MSVKIPRVDTTCWNIDTDLPDHIRIGDLDERCDDLCTVQGTAGAGADFADDDGPANEIGQDGAQSARGYGLGVVLLAASGRPDGAVLGQRNHQQGLAHGDEKPEGGYVSTGPTVEDKTWDRMSLTCPR